MNHHHFTMFGIIGGALVIALLLTRLPTRYEGEHPCENPVWESTYVDQDGKEYVVWNNQTPDATTTLVSSSFYCAE